MGNSPSKPAGGAPSSPAATSHNYHSSRRKEPVRRNSTQATGAIAPNSDSTSNSNPPPASQGSSHTASHIPSRRLSHQPSPSVDSSSSQRTKKDENMGNIQAQQQWKDKQDVRKRERGEREEQSHPVTVPRNNDSRRQRGPDSQFEPSGPPRDINYIPPSNLNFPPRLPLPIETEVYTPGSPIISPADFSTALQEYNADGVLPRRTSILSSTTVDEDDIDDELQAYTLDASRGRTVPTLVEWKQKGEKVYITGTFASWSKKYRMHRDPNTNVLSTTLDLPPGTHHVKFIVDGDMQLSKELPQAVDYTNILVNYIEVSADDIPKEPSGKDMVPEKIHPPLVLPPGIDAKDHAPDFVREAQAPEGDQPIEPLYYGNTYPEYLLDLDREETSNRFQRAAGGVADVPPPPTLPLFLGKSILNGSTPMKDDNSVLNMPNHTVLNHLSTSSIKNEVLATALTTRYKRKFLTTIMYRPTTIDDDS